MTRKRMGHGRTIVLAFFIGGATSAIAFDLSDYVNYQQQTSGVALTPFMQAFLYAGFPALYYFLFVGLGYVLFRYTRVSPLFLIYFYAATILIAAYLSTTLPQNVEPFFSTLVLIGVAISAGVLWGLMREVRGR